MRGRCKKNLLIQCVNVHKNHSLRKSEDRSWESALSFHREGAEDPTQVIRFGSRHLYPQSHLLGHRSRDFVKTQSIMSTWIKFQDGSFLIKVQLYDGFWSFQFWTPPPLSFPLLTSGSFWKAGNQKQIYLLSWFLLNIQSCLSFLSFKKWLLFLAPFQNYLWMWTSKRLMNYNNK